MDGFTSPLNSVSEGGTVAFVVKCLDGSDADLTTFDPSTLKVIMVKNPENNEW